MNWSANSISKHLTQASMVKKKDQDKQTNEQTKPEIKTMKLQMITSFSSCVKPATEL